MYLAAAVQLNATSNTERNWEQLTTLVGRAAKYGASLVASPENTNFLGPHDLKVQIAETLQGETVQRYQDLANTHGIHLLIGSVNERSDESNRCYNTSVLLGPNGDLLASYRKMHLFDVDVSDDVRFLESTTTVPGNTPVVADTALGRIGLSICYDLRFPQLYQRLRDDGAELIAVPSAFTMTTGQAHWNPLLRARAIETQSYVLAPGQYGHHDDDGLRHSYGHSIIVDPWGAVTGQSSDGPGLALAEVDLERLRSIRRSMPITEHRRL
ncbi:MAG: putative amidohydrolase [Myxococcota bacterium]|jgi:predicted amidohydrolase